MKKRWKEWKEYLPAPLHGFLSRVKAFLCRIFFSLLYAVFSHQPIQNRKIIFDNYQGKGFGCNTKYVARKMIERGDADKYDLVWLVSRRDLRSSELPPQIRAVRYGSLKSYFEYATAKVWVSNYHKIDMIRRGLHKREEQVFIQMWHGSLGIKKIEGDVSVLTQDRPWLKAAIASSEMTDWWISNSNFETDIYKNAFWGVTDEKVLLYGHPRNDIFFDGQMMARARQKVDEAYGTGGKKLLLYAPTFRSKVVRGRNMIERHVDISGLSYPELLEHLRGRFSGGWTVLVRVHPRIRDMMTEHIPMAGNIVDASYYADMQELLAAADCLITDYSSCAFDFMLTRRPVFLYATDIREYDTERGFYYPLEATPFPLAHDDAELQKNIDGFDEAAYRQGVEAFLQGKGCIEDGHASERVVELIKGICGK